MKLPIYPAAAIRYIPSMFKLSTRLHRKFKNSSANSLKKKQTKYLGTTLHHHHHNLFLKRPFPPRLARVRCFADMRLLHISLNTTHRVQTKLIHIIIYTLSPSLPALPAHLTPATTTFLQADTQSSPHLRSTCPNHHNLPRLTTSATLWTAKRLQILSFNKTLHIHLAIIRSRLCRFLDNTNSNLSVYAYYELIVRGRMGPWTSWFVPLYINFPRNNFSFGWIYMDWNEREFYSMEAASAIAVFLFVWIPPSADYSIEWEKFASRQLKAAE